MEHSNKQTRREFLAKSALGVAGMALTANWLSSCTRGSRKELDVPPLLNRAPDGETLRAGLVGCGGRGTGAAIDFLNAGPNLELTAMADIFEDKLVDSRKSIQKQTGNEYDNFSVDFVYEGDVHVHSMCRQIDGCANNVSEFLRGTKGYSDGRTFINNSAGEQIWAYNEEEKANEPHFQEQIHLVTAIRRNEPVNVAEFTARSTLAAIMGRVSAYTGQKVTWEEMMNSNLRLGPKGGAESVTSLGSSELVNSKVPVPGSG
jgi:predicted dehydrogenase